jgi:hypothetical protein
MARETNAIVIFDDLRYMSDNQGFIANQNIPTGNECVTKSELIQNLYVYENYISSYIDNELIPYHLIKQGVKSLTLLTGSPNKDTAYNNSGIYDTVWFKENIQYPEVGDYLYDAAVDGSLVTGANSLNYHRIQYTDLLIAIHPNGYVLDIIDMSQTLSVNTTNKNVIDEANSFSITVSSNSTWEVLESSSWISINGASGSGNDTFNVSVSENTGNSRSTTITVRNMDGANSIQININQDSVSATVFSHQLGFNRSSSNTACSATKTTFYTDSSYFFSSSQLYTDSSGNNFASAGYYSNGVEWLKWDSRSLSVTQSGFCSGGI